MINSQIIIDANIKAVGEPINYALAPSLQQVILSFPQKDNIFENKIHFNLEGSLNSIRVYLAEYDVEKLILYLQEHLKE